MGKKYYITKSVRIFSLLFLPLILLVNSIFIYLVFYGFSLMQNNLSYIIPVIGSILLVFKFTQVTLNLLINLFWYKPIIIVNEDTLTFLKFFYYKQIPIQDIYTIEYELRGLRKNEPYIKIVYRFKDTYKTDYIYSLSPNYNVYSIVEDLQKILKKSSK